MKMRILRCLGLLGLLLAHFVASATHQRAAEITYSHVSGLTYEFVMTMYTYTPSLADDQRDSLAVLWGDGSWGYMHRYVFTNLDDNYSLNKYRAVHTFSSSGTYNISVEDANRNYGVVNIPMSGNTPMFVQTELIINPFLGNNNSPIFLNPPIDQACVGMPFVHNAAAYDPDGDSLCYHLVSCRGNAGEPIPGYIFPENLTINAITGDIIWNFPTLQGEYNIAFEIEEYRSGSKIGTVMRDMQILVSSCDNQLPQLNVPADTCVMVDDTLAFCVTASDSDGVTLSALGGVLQLSDNPAVVSPSPAIGNPSATMCFNWIPDCLKVRNTPYYITFKAKDANSIASLTNQKTMSISVLAPAVENVVTTAQADNVNLSWNMSLCSNAIGYYVYRRLGNAVVDESLCETGLPASSGYSLINAIHGIETTSFTDEGLVQGLEYCYRIVTFFTDGALSKVSEEACVVLQNDLPLMTHVSNDSMNLDPGFVKVVWSTPKQLDMIAHPGPYKYVLKRAVDNAQNQVVYTATSISDTTFFDTQISLNTVEKLSYHIDFYVDGDTFYGSSIAAQSIRLEAQETDNAVLLGWRQTVPWIVDSSQVFKQTQSGFVKVFSTSNFMYNDTAVVNETSYSYFVRTFGHYQLNGIINPIVNYSAVIEATPIDNVAPQAPELSVETDCESISNILNWTLPPDDDLQGFKIYYKQHQTDDFQLLATINDASNNSFVHDNITSVVGCYYVAAFDEKSNESEHSNVVCIDYETCVFYELPNVFTPNNDGINDFFRPKKNSSVDISRIDMHIFNRWGRVVFTTEDPKIMWDGKDEKTQLDLNGTFFYTCIVYFESLDGPKSSTLQGMVAVYRDRVSKN